MIARKKVVRSYNGGVVAKIIKWNLRISNCHIESKINSIYESDI
jgi:hypothetical protein